MSNWGGGYPPGGGPPPGYPPPPPQQGGYQQPQHGGWQAPPPGMPPGYTPSGGHAPLEGGVAWEQADGNLFARWWSTMAAINFKGKSFWAAASQSDDAMAGCTFGVTSGAIVGAISGLFLMLYVALFGAAISAAMGRSGASAAGATVAFAVFGWMASVLFWAMLGFVGPWVGGGIHHLLLMMFGGVGEHKDYAHTVRAHAYAQAAAFVWVMVPFVGGMISIGMSLKNHIEGYDGMHRCGSGKAVGVWILPWVCCCCGYGLFNSLLLSAAGFK